MLLDFSEIPVASGGSGVQDTFELFAREFLESMGFVIEEHPDRGADGKKDLIVKEVRAGLTGISEIRWLVSCKHYFKSGKSVSDVDEPDINDRLAAHSCQGFMGVYSTLPATSLSGKLRNRSFQAEIFDRERIEKVLLESSAGFSVAKRFFPISFAKFRQENPVPAALFDDQDSLFCENCGKDVLASGDGIYVMLREDIDTESDSFSIPPYTDMYFSCKGKCDEQLKRKYAGLKLVDGGWEDLKDFTIPTSYLKMIMSFLNSVHTNKDIQDKAFEKVKKMLITIFPHISRELSSKEQARVAELLRYGQLW